MLDSLTNQFLIAMPAVHRGPFAQTVTLVCEHNEKGALGIIINRPLKMRLADVFEQYKLPQDKSPMAQQLVLRGGPVQQEQGFVIHRAGATPWSATLLVSERIHLTTSPDIIDAIANGSGPEQAFVALGYAGWDAGQLEAELSQNAWLTAPCDERVLFDLPHEQRWLAAGQLIGIDLAKMSPQIGHA